MKILVFVALIVAFGHCQQQVAPNVVLTKGALANVGQAVSQQIQSAQNEKAQEILGALALAAAVGPKGGQIQPLTGIAAQQAAAFAARVSKNVPKVHGMFKPTNCDCKNTVACVRDYNNGYWYNQCYANCAGIPTTSLTQCPAGDQQTMMGRHQAKLKACKCPRYNYGVCSKSGRYFHNPCLAKCHGVTSYKKCNKPEWLKAIPKNLDRATFQKCLSNGCPARDDPVCDLNSPGKRWKNACIARCSGAKEFRPCPPAYCTSPGCPDKQEDVCQIATGRRWRNACFARCEGITDAVRCPPIECLASGDGCPSVDAPVCDPKNPRRRWKNSCFAHCELFTNWVPCLKRCNCRRGGNPVCDPVSGREYENECIGRCNGMTKVAVPCGEVPMKPGVHMQGAPEVGYHDELPPAEQARVFGQAVAKGRLPGRTIFGRGTLANDDVAAGRPHVKQAPPAIGVGQGVVGPELTQRKLAEVAKNKADCYKNSARIKRTCEENVAVKVKCQLQWLKNIKQCLKMGAMADLPDGTLPGDEPLAAVQQKRRKKKVSKTAHSGDKPGWAGKKQDHSKDVPKWAGKGGNALAFEESDENMADQVSNEDEENWM